MTKREERPFSAPAIVVGGGVNALGVVRSLGVAGVPVWVLDDNDRSSAMRSRFAHPRRVRALEGEAFMRDLNALASELAGPAVVYLTEEKTVVAVSAMRDQLAPSLRLRLPSHERLLALMHKEGFQRLAEELKLPVPPAVRLTSSADLPKLERLRFPCVFKPSEKNYEYGARFKKAYKVSSAQEVAGLYAQIEPVMPDMVVQEWIEGHDSDIYFCLQYLNADGVPVMSFPGRKIRSWPPRIGGTASCTAAWADESELAEMTAAFFRAVGFSGMGSMEFKRDARDGLFYMVEPTVARTDFQEEVATVNGYNLPLAAYCHELGLPLALPQRADPPRVWRDAQADRWSQDEGGDSLDVQVFADLPVVDAFRRLSDWRPWTDHLVGRLRERLRLWMGLPG